MQIYILFDYIYNNYSFFQTTSNTSLTGDGVYYAVFVQPLEEPELEILHDSPGQPGSAAAFELYNQRYYQHVDTHAQKVIRNLDKGAGGNGGIDVNLFKYQWQQGSP